MSCEWKVALARAIRQRGETLIFPCPSQAQETPFLEESGTLAVFLHQLNTSARALLKESLCALARYAMQHWDCLKPFCSLSPSRRWSITPASVWESTSITTWSAGSGTIYAFPLHHQQTPASDTIGHNWSFLYVTYARQGSGFHLDLTDIVLWKGP